MVIKGSARANPGELAYHLLREDTNESVRVLGFSDLASGNLRDALFELDGMGAGSRSRRTLYHASINTPVSEMLTPEQQRIARERLALRCGLQGQPFAVVEHVKHGRQHTHVVWSRIDVERGRAIPDSHNYRQHELVSRELEREFGHTPVLGAHIRDKEAEPRPERGPSWAEQRQTERSGMPAAEAKRIVTECWTQTETGQAFRRRLEEAGFTVARGDRRDFVLVDGAGEVHGLSRRIEGAKAADVRKRMSDIDAGQLPDVEEARRRLEAAQGSGPGVVFEGPVERLRSRENEKRTDSTRSVLSGTNREVADALRSLNRTMRDQVEQTIVSKPDEAARRAVREAISNRLEPSWPAPAFDPRFAREQTGAARKPPSEPERIEPVPRRPPPFNPAQAREETKKPEGPAPPPTPPADTNQNERRSLADELREQLKRGSTPGRGYGRGL